MSFTWNGLPPEKSALLKAHGGERVVAVRPALVRALRGNGNAAILLSQFLYWSAISRDPNGWFFNSRERLLEQTGLGKDAQKSARALLTQLGLIEETRAGLPAKLYTRINLALTAKLIADAEEQYPLQLDVDHARQQEGGYTRQQDADHARQQVGGYGRQHSKEEKITKEIKEKSTEAAAQKKPTAAAEAKIRKAVLEALGESINYEMGAVSPKFTSMLHGFVKAAIAKNRTAEDVKRWREELPAYLMADPETFTTPTINQLVNTFDRVLEQKPKAATMSEADLDALAKKFA